MATISKVLILLLITVIALNTYGQSSVDKKLDRLTNKFEKLYQKQKYDRALSILEKLIELDSLNYTAYMKKGEILYNFKNNPNASYKTFKIAKKVSPQSSTPYYYLGIIKFDKQEYDSAKVWFLEAINLKSTEYRYHKYKGFSNVSLGIFEEAIEDLTTAMLLYNGPNDANLANMLAQRGTCYSEVGQTQLALLDFDRAIAMDATNASYFSNRGVAQRRLGNYAKALEDYFQALELDSTDPKTYHNIGVAYYHMENLNECIKWELKALKYIPTYVEARLNLANSYLKMQRYKQAMEVYSDLIRTGDSLHSAYYSRAHAKMHLGDTTGALQDINLFVAQDSTNYEYYFYRGKFNIKLGLIEEAIADYKQGYNLNTSEVWLVAEIADLYNGLGKDEEAIQFYTEVIKTDSNKAWAYYNIGFIKFENQEFAEAVMYFDSTLFYDTVYHYAYANRGNAKLEIGDIEGACSDWKIALEMGYDFQLEWREEYNIEDPVVLIERYCND